MAGYIGSRASVVSSGAERKKTFDITGTTTVLTGLSYTPTFVHLFHNGVRLVDGTDYTATNGTSITLTTAAENGDQVVVVSYATFQAADAYTKAEADAGFVSDPNGAVTVDGSGNVGIGTAAPSAKMGINAAAPDFTFLQSDAVKYRMGVSNVTNGGVTGSASGDYFARTSGGKMMFSTNDGVTAHATIDSSGNVGIGTATPASYNAAGQNLVISDSAGASGLTIASSTTGSGHILFADSTVGTGAYDGLIRYDHPTQSMRFGVNAGAERMRIDSAGRVTMPYQPVISGQIGTAMTIPAAPQLLDFNEFWSSVGITYNSTTRRFTVPVAGKYRITINPFWNQGAGIGRLMVGVNNDAPVQSTHYGHTYKGSNDYETGCINSVVSLSANDYVVFKLFQGALYNTLDDKFNQFSIQLIG